MIYICGDSFAVPDPDYGAMWVDLLQEKVKYPVVNLAQVCASNLVISQQVHSIVDAKFVIVLFSASTRSQTLINNRTVPFSWHSLDSTTPFNDQQLSILKQYAGEFFDLPLAIYENQCIIEATLQRLVNRGQPFRFDQGGFEHPSFGSSSKYFEQYSDWRSDICLWDCTRVRHHRPYYHITDLTVHQQVADYYSEIINKIYE
jgi:hypothetical protein